MVIVMHFPRSHCFFVVGTRREGGERPELVPRLVAKRSAGPPSRSS